MKAIKNGRTLREDIGIVARGIREFRMILPGQMMLVTGKSVLAAGIPYIAVIFSAYMMNELTQGKNGEKLILYAAASIGLTLGLYLFKSYLEAKIAVGYSYLFDAHEIRLTDKAYDLPYEMLEKNEVRSLREQVSGNIDVSGAGMASLYWDMEVVWTNLFRAIIAVILCADFFGKLLHSGSSPVEAFGTVLLLALLTGICAYISCKVTSKRFDVSMEVFLNGAKYNRYGEFYTMNYLSDENIALDIRIFEQKKLILEESQKRCYEPFAKGAEREMRAAALGDGGKLSCTALCGAAVYLLAGRQALLGTIEIGSIVMVYGAVTMLVLALGELAQIVTDLRNNNEHLLRYFAYVDLPEECMDAEKNTEERKQGTECVAGICLEHVSFRYPDSESWVLRDVSLTVRAGEKMAIVGENGSGKTTLIKLLCRLYHPTQGRILWNGRDIWSYPHAEYVGMISTVFQDFSLFAFSLGENVAAARDYDMHRVKQALEISELKNKLEKLPKGLEQTLFHDFEEDGTDLSGGEAQKVAIARAVYKEALLMILDEPTAALDPYAEYEVYQKFHDITGKDGLSLENSAERADKIVLSISHRLSSCRMCDRIAVLEEGELVQVGTHNELAAQKEGKYAMLWKAQAQSYGVGKAAHKQ